MKLVLQNLKISFLFQNCETFENKKCPSLVADLVVFRSVDFDCIYSPGTKEYPFFLFFYLYFWRKETTKGKGQTSF